MSPCHCLETGSHKESLTVKTAFLLLCNTSQPQLLFLPSFSASQFQPSLLPIHLTSEKSRPPRYNSQTWKNKYNQTRQNPSHWRHFLAADGSGCLDPQPDIMQTESKLRPQLGPLSWSLGNSFKEWEEIL